MMIKKFGIFFLVLIWGTPMSHGQTIKEPNVSGQFYTGDPAELSLQIETFFSKVSGLPDGKKIEMILAPHAGYVYSGQVAAHSFKAAQNQSYKTIVIVAPSHFFPFDTASIWPEGGFRTPLGTVEVDTDFAKQLLDSSENFRYDPHVFEQEHSLEVEIPFLQKTFKDFKIVPIIAGQLSFPVCQELAAALHKVIGERKDVLVVISSDLSHYHDDSFARKMDDRTLQAVENLQAENLYKQCRVGTMEMCGFIPATMALELAKLRGWKAQRITYANSGDVTGDKKRVVGYGSVVFYQPQENSAETPSENSAAVNSEDAIAPLSAAQKKTLVTIARETIEQYVRQGTVKELGTLDERLMETEGAFVTINKHGQLRGCIGNIVSQDPLAVTVRNMAVSAATRDPRFRPVTEKELKDIEIEVSVLSKPRRVKSHEEIEVGKHGVIVKRGFQGGVFLPQVAEEWGWGKEEFLSNLCSHKAGLAPDAWKDPATILEVFTAEVFSEKDVGDEE